MRYELARSWEKHCFLLACNRVEWAVGCYFRPLVTRLLSLLNLCSLINIGWAPSWSLWAVGVTRLTVAPRNVWLSQW